MNLTKIVSVAQSLARSAVNRKAGGSSLPGHGSFGFINNNSDNYFLFSPATITVDPSII